MPTIAVLGATGQTGSEIVRQLLPTQHTIHIYARNPKTLYAKLPELYEASHTDESAKSTSPSARARVKVFIGDLDDTANMRDCLASADIILSTIASNQNEPGCSIATRAAHSIVSAIRAGPKRSTPPRLVLLSSMSLNPGHIAREGSTWGYRFLYFALHHVYDDVKRAIAYLESQDCLILTLAEPGGLIHHAATGVELIVEGTDMGSDLVPYEDLADAMIQMGIQEGCGGKHIGIRVKGEKELGVGEFVPLMRYLLPGLLASVSPALWRLGRGWWPA